MHTEDDSMFYTSTAYEDYETTVEYVLLTNDGQAVIDIPILNDEFLEDMLERFEVRVTAMANVSGVTAEIPQESVYVFIVDADDGMHASLTVEYTYILNKYSLTTFFCNIENLVLLSDAKLRK